MRVGLFNVKFSPNLGDGLLSECLEAELRNEVPEVTIKSFDLAGRKDYQQGVRFRGAALRLLQSCPTLVRQNVARVMLSRILNKLKPVWKAQLEQVDVAVIGGGNLFSDSDLNFPLKVHAVCSLLRDAGIPVGVFAVGVADNWSGQGTKLFQRAFADMRILDASVRDLRSAEVWNQRLGSSGVPQARVVHDPGLLVALHVPRVRIRGDRPRIGLGLTHPTTLRYHADEEPVAEATQTGWYAEVVRLCISRGWQVCIFTNGSPEDENYLKKIRPSLAAIDPAPGDSPRITFASRFSRPAELATYISGLDLLMAHRLHANIAAYSYGVPHIGFSWDSKLRSFFASVDREDYVCIAGREPVSTLLALADRCLIEKLDPHRHAKVLEAARSDVRSFAQALRYEAPSSAVLPS